MKKSANENEPNKYTLVIQAKSSLPIQCHVQLYFYPLITKTCCHLIVATTHCIKVANCWPHTGSNPVVLICSLMLYQLSYTDQQSSGCHSSPSITPPYHFFTFHFISILYSHSFIHPILEYIRTNRMLYGGLMAQFE